MRTASGRGSTDGLWAIKTAEAAARLRRSCSGEESISPENEAKLALNGDRKVKEQVENGVHCRSQSKRPARMYGGAFSF